MLFLKDYSIKIFLVKYSKLLMNCKLERSVSLNLLSVIVGCSGRFVAKFIGFKFMVDLGEIYLFCLVSLGTAKMLLFFNISVKKHNLSM